jgi:HprK-related kinase A
MPESVKLSGLSQRELEHCLLGEGLVLRTGPFLFRLHSPHRVVSQGLATMYADHTVLPADTLVDFDLSISGGVGLHRHVRRQARFIFDGRPVFEPLPAAHAYALLEWAMNWCISSHAHQYLIVHAAVIERSGAAVILPAPPGSGKSTLCAGLIHSGWRLLSDELTLIDMRDGLIWPLCRPVSLKKESIAVMQRFAPQARFGRVTHDTAKGSVVHMKVPTSHLAEVDVPARARWIVYPRFAEGAPTEMTPRTRASALVDLARNAFNFGLQGEAGFDRLCSVVHGCDCADFSYSDMQQAVVAFDAMAGSAA